MERVKNAILVLMGCLLITTSVYAAQDPVIMLKNTTSRLLKAIDNNRSTIRSNPKYLEQLIRRIVLPHVNMTVVARSIVGRQHWLGASNSEKEAFKHELVGYVVRTYASAFSAYKGQEVRLYPYRGSLEGKQRVVIHSKVVPDKGQAINVSYRLLRQGNQWQVYDISVDGVSMVRSYRAQFSEILDRKGLSGLTQELKEKQS
jgi:phospholipid transport system substrate-binding protein